MNESFEKHTHKCQLKLLQLSVGPCKTTKVSVYSADQLLPQYFVNVPFLATLITDCVELVNLPTNDRFIGSFIIELVSVNTVQATAGADLEGGKGAAASLFSCIFETKIDQPSLDFPKP